MGFKEVDPMQGNLVEYQRAGLLYWWDIRYRHAKIPSLPHVLSHQRRDFTEEVLRRWAIKGELFTHEPD